MFSVLLDSSIFEDVTNTFLDIPGTNYQAPITRRHVNKSQKNGHMKLTLQQSRYFCKANEMFKTARECFYENQEILSAIVHTSFHV